MSRHQIPAIVESLGRPGCYRICAPRPAFLLESRLVGEAILPFHQVAVARVLGQRYVWSLPESVDAGLVTVAHHPTGRHPVAYREPLLDIGPLETRTSSDAPQESGTSTSEKGLSIDAPTHGIFYRRPDPESPAFVEVGQIVKRGQVLGLVEVMKTFHQIRVEGNHLPERVEIVEAMVEDTSEVEPGQPLFRVRAPS